MAEITSKSTISHRNRTMPCLSQYLISHGGQSFMGHDMHRLIYGWSYLSVSGDIQRPVHQLKSNVQYQHPRRRYDHQH